MTEKQAKQTGLLAAKRTIIDINAKEPYVCFGNAYSTWHQARCAACVFDEQCAQMSKQIDWDRAQWRRLEWRAERNLMYDGSPIMES